MSEPLARQGQAGYGIVLPLDHGDCPRWAFVLLAAPPGQLGGPSGRTVDK
jgi:hypothetical protein